MIIEDLSTVPHFGFGLMRLPVLDADDKTKIDYEQLNHMVDAFLDAGFTYFDTAYRYRVDGCPMQIEIPELFRAMNAATLYGNGMRPYCPPNACDKSLTRLQASALIAT